MKNIKKLVSAIMITAMSFSVMSCSMIQKTPEAIKNTVLAKVSNEKITKGEVDRELTQYIEQFKQTYGENFESDPSVKEQLDSYRKNAIENLVDEKVLLIKAKELNLIPSEEELKKEVDEKIASLVSLYGSEEKLEEAKKTFGYTDETFNEFMKNQVIAQKVIDYIHKDIAVTDEDIKKYYDENKDKYTKQPGATMYHILVDTEEKAKDVKRRLDSGESFADLAKEFNEDSTKDTGGSLGYVEYSNEDFDKDFMTAAKALGEGQVSGPVKTQFGYHIIKVDGVNKDKKVQSLEEVKDTIKSELETTKKNDEYTKKLDEWKKELNVKLYLDRL